LRLDLDLRTPSSPLRSEYRLPAPARGAGAGVLGPLARWRAPGDRRNPVPSVVHRRAVPSRAEVEALGSPSAVRLLHRRGGEAVEARMMSDAELFEILRGVTTDSLATVMMKKG